MNLRTAVFLLLTTVSASAQAPPRGKAAAPPPEVTATVQLAPGGELAGPWQTFVVDLDNKTTRELDVTVRIEDESYLSVATRRERLAVGSRKRLFLYAAGTMFMRGIQPRYKIADAAGRELASGVVSITMRGAVNNPYQVGLFSRTAASSDDFGISSSINSQELRFGRLTPATFPDRWVGLASLDLLVIHDAALDELTPDQTRALSEYVRMGGSVLLAPGVTKGWLSHPVLQQIASVRAGEPQLVSKLAGLNEALPSLRGTDSFLVHPLLNGTPFRQDRYGREIVQFATGFGHVFVLSFDLLRAPFDTWKGRNLLWTDLLTTAPRWFQDERNCIPNAASMQQRLDLFSQMSRLINPYPSFGLIFGLAAIFLFVVGPVNYLLLWRLRRTLLLVVTIPSISIGFLALIFGLGYLLKGTTTVVHSARLLTTRPGFDCAREIHLFSLFSPSTRSYDVTCEPGTFGQPPARFGTSDYRFSGKRFDSMTSLTCETGAGITLKGLSTGQWQSWDLEARAIREMGQGIRFDVEGPTVRIANSSPRHIERGIYVQIDREPFVVPFGEIAPGKTGEAKLDGNRRSPIEALGFAPETLGDRLLRSWLETVIRKPRPYDASEQKSQKFLLCVLKNDGDPIRVDARISDRSQSITLLHVGDPP